MLQIPRYQRPYSWKVENAQELLTDLLTFMGDGSSKVENLPPYFLGSIVLVKGDGRPEADVIDGQQRLTTLTILLAALRAATETPFSDGLTEFLYQAGNPVTGAPNQYRLTLRLKDANFFREFVQEPGGLLKLAALARALTDTEQRIRENAELFERDVAALPLERRQRLASYVVQRCYLVVVSTPDTDVRVAETEGVIGGVYAVGDAVYYTSDAAPQSILWRMDNSATAPERIAQLPGPTYALFDGHHLLGTCPTFESTQTFWTMPLDGGELTKVTELDACDSAVTSRSVDSSLAASDV